MLQRDVSRQPQTRLQNPLVLGMVVPHDMAVEQAGAVAKVEIAESAVHPEAWWWALPWNAQLQ